jgi:RNA polymerase subunit RPABC4/transcription elongation factor Spt4
MIWSNEPDYRLCLNCGKVCDPDLYFCPACEGELGFNMYR